MHPSVCTLSAVQEGDPASNSSNASPENITNNTRTAPTSQATPTQFQTPATGVPEVTVLSQENFEPCPVESDFSSCQQSSTDNLSTSSSLVSKVNATNNSFQTKSGGEVPSRGGVAVAEPTTFPFFGAIPDAVRLDVFAATMATPQPVFGSPVVESPDNEVDVAKSIQISQAQNKPDPVKQAYRVSAAAPKLADVRTEVRCYRRSPSPVVPDTCRIGTGTGRCGQNGTPVPESCSAPKTITVVSEGSAVVKGQKEAGATVAATGRGSCAAQTTTKDDAEAAQNHLEITLPVDAFTLHRTVEQQLERDAGEAELDAFTLHRTVRQLLELQKTKSKPEVTRRGIPAGSRHASGVVAEERRGKVGNADAGRKEAGFRRLSGTGDQEDGNPSKSSKRNVLRVTVKPVVESEGQDDVKAKRKIRFEVIEDLPSPIAAEDWQVDKNFVKVS